MIQGKIGKCKVVILIGSDNETEILLVPPP
jgi:hypothetical protein